MEESGFWKARGHKGDRCPPAPDHQKYWLSADKQASVMFFCSSATFHSMMALFGDRIFPKSSFYPKKAKFCSVKVGSKQDQRDFRMGEPQDGLGCLA